MLIRDRAVNRGVEKGVYPLEVLARDASLIEAELSRPPLSLERINHTRSVHTPLAAAAADHLEIYRPFLSGEAATSKAPLPDDVALRTREIKGAAHYLDADLVGICKLADSVWANDTQNDCQQTHTHAVVLAIRHGRPADPNTTGSSWLKNSEAEIARMRGAEIAACLAGHIRTLGYSALGQVKGASVVDLERLAVLAGIAQRVSQPERLVTPFFDSFEIAVVTCDYPLETQLPLATNARINPVKHWLGINGAMSGREHRRVARRPAHYSRYPMETLARIERPTTLILDDEIPRVPQRANFFMRARGGDLGKKAQREVSRFAVKHPLTHGMMGPLRALVPHQDDVPLPDPALDKVQLSNSSTENTQALQALAYHLGVDLVGICKIPNYAWYSHRPDGTPTDPYHKYAVVMLIDQGYDTMEGASGDDWISGCQSMRGYLRGAEIAGVMANFLRRLGADARPQTNADSDVLQIPLVLLAGLGELSRIGELVLNPFVGPRFKSVVLTTDLELDVDKPIDFGLQEFCSNCLKCARECPVSAIPFGDKVMFNGYEIWKPDVERCTNYRVANPKGSACGRCMKTCPLNKVVTADGALTHRLGSWLGINARFLKKWLVPIAVKLDDVLGYGRRNPVKRWWLDLEIVDDEVRKPRGTNERDLDLERDTTGSKSPVGYYHASDMPPPSSDQPVPTNHRAAIKRAELIETVTEARERAARKGPRPDHYIAISPKRESP